VSKTHHLFTLRIRLGKAPTVIIHAFEAPYYQYSATGHTRIDVEVRQGGKTIFLLGDTYCAVPRGTSLDGIEAIVSGGDETGRHRSELLRLLYARATSLG
jgi:hypothetical protein